MYNEHFINRTEKAKSCFSGVKTGRNERLGNAVIPILYWTSHWITMTTFELVRVPMKTEDRVKHGMKMKASDSQNFSQLIRF